MGKLVAAAVLAAALLCGGCSGAGYGNVGPTNTASGNGNPGGSTQVAQKSTSTALFQPLQGILPYPTDLYFAGSTDGTLNIQPTNPLIPAQFAVNALDGFSTNAVIRERFGGALDAASLNTAGAVVVVHITTDNRTKAPVPPSQGGVVQPLTPGIDYTVAPAAEDPSILEIKPVHPLAASSCLAAGAACATGEGYLVLLTKAITLGGSPATADSDYASFEAALPTCSAITNASLHAICLLTGAHLQYAQALGINPANVVASFGFTTGSTIDTMAAAAAQATAQPIKLNFTGNTTAAFLPAGAAAGIADVYVGTLTLPYYLSRTSPDTEYWHAAAASSPDQTSTFTTRYNPFPVQTETLMVPVLMTVPNASSGMVKPATGWPIVIYQHGLVVDRTTMLAVSEALAHAGFVAIAMDLPLHGLTVPFNPANPTTYLYATGANPLYAGLGLPASGSIERTFDLDTLNNTTGAPGADGVIDATGSHYINLASLLTFRDNLRQSSADLVTLAKSVSGISLPLPATAPYIDGTRIHFIAHSTGAITGTAFLAVSPGVGTATLSNAGGAFITLGVESPRFGPRLIAGLAAASGGLIVPGTTIFAQYVRDAQSVIDAGDPWNFIAPASAMHAIHMIEVIGPPPDQVVPNDATDRLIAAGGFTQVHPPGAASAGGLHSVVKFTAGTHGSLLDPTASPAATQEMQTEAVAFALTGGTSLPVSPTAPVQ